RVLRRDLRGRARRGRRQPGDCADVLGQRPLDAGVPGAAAELSVGIELVVELELGIIRTSDFDRDFDFDRGTLMQPLDLILVGCGLMGGRHLRGYGELERARPGSLRLRAVCDLRPEAAERVAAEAEALLGYRPRACGSAAEALDREPGITAADVVTEPRTHP